MVESVECDGVANPPSIIFTSKCCLLLNSQIIKVNNRPAEENPLRWEPRASPSRTRNRARCFSRKDSPPSASTDKRTRSCKPAGVESSLTGLTLRLVSSVSRARVRAKIRRIERSGKLRAVLLPAVNSIASSSSSFGVRQRACSDHFPFSSIQLGSLSRGNAMVRSMPRTMLRVQCTFTRYAFGAQNDSEHRMACTLT